MEAGSGLLLPSILYLPRETHLFLCIFLKRLCIPAYDI